MPAGLLPPAFAAPDPHRLADITQDRRRHRSAGRCAVGTTDRHRYRGDRIHIPRKLGDDRARHGRHAGGTGQRQDAGHTRLLIQYRDIADKIAGIGQIDVMDTIGNTGLGNTIIAALKGAGRIDHQHRPMGFKDRPQVTIAIRHDRPRVRQHFCKTLGGRFVSSRHQQGPAIRRKAFRQPCSKSAITAENESRLQSTRSA